MARKPPVSHLALGAHTRATRASAVYEQLRSDITRGILAPESKLRVAAMCERYKVGASPLREALSRLSAEGLVAKNDQRGFSVSPIQWDQLYTLTKTRLQLESLALRESIECRDQAWEEHLVLLIHKLGRVPRSLSKTIYQPNPEWEDLHRAFHRGLLSRCTSSWLLSFCDTLADEAYRYRQLAAGRVFSSRNEHAEHLALFEAAIHGRVDEALELLRQHFSKTHDAVQAQASELGHTP